jgi:hypothetical protein
MKKRQEEKHLTIRLPATLLDDMRLLAELNHRSLNGEMVVAILAYRDSHKEQVETRKQETVEQETPRAIAS